jgi:hypothetical protein
MDGATARREKRLSSARRAKLQKLAARENHKWRYDRVKEYIQQRIDASPSVAALDAHGRAAQAIVDQTVDRIVEDSSFIFRVRRGA